MRMMILTLLTAVYGAVALSSPLSVRDIRELLPSNQELKNWTQTDSVRIYSGEDLFTMIDGGADIYLEYGFVQAAAVDYSNQSHSLTAEIYEMTSETSAFGIYSVSKSRNGMIITGECETQLNSTYILFYKDHYFGIINSSDSADISIKGMKDLFGIINNNITTSCSKPKLVNLMPPNGLKDIKIVHGVLGLSTITTFDTKDVFCSKQAVIGYYDSAMVFIFHYDSENKAESVFVSLRTNIKNNSRFSKFTGNDKFFQVINVKQEIVYFETVNKTIVLVQTPHQYDINHYFDEIKNLIKNNTR